MQVLPTRYAPVLADLQSCCGCEQQSAVFHPAGFCPFTEFERTKHDFGACQNLHDDSCKADWEKLDDKEKDRLGYERELKRWIDKLMGDLRAKIARNEERLSQQEVVVVLPEDQVQALQLLESAETHSLSGSLTCCL